MPETVNSPAIVTSSGKPIVSEAALSATTLTSFVVPLIVTASVELSEPVRVKVAELVPLVTGKV